MTENPVPNEDVIRLAEKEEPRFLSILLKDVECLSDAVSFGVKPSPRGKPGHFMVDKNNFLYTLIFKNFEKYNTLLTRGAMDSLIDLQDFGTEEEKASIKSYWDKVWNRHDVSVEDYKLLRDHLNDRYVLWQFYNTWRNGEGIINSSSDYAEKIKAFGKEFNAMENLDPDPYSLTMGLNEGIDRAVKFIENRREHPEEGTSILTGIKGIDAIYNGFMKPSYTVVSGMIGGGKTTLMMNFAFNMAKAGYKVVYVSLEKDADLFFRRILSLHALTDYNRIKRGGMGQYGLTDFWYNKLKKAAIDLQENIKPNLDCLQFVPTTKLTKIFSGIDRIKEREKLDALFVDYLQVIGFESVHPTRPDLDLAHVHKRLMAYGKENKLATFTALQLKSASSKNIREKTKKVVSENDLNKVNVETEDYSGSQSIIADADNGIGCVLNQDRPATKIFISPSKTRDDAQVRTVALAFDGRISRISDPIYGSGQVKSVDDVVFNKQITEEQLASEDNLFSETEEKVTKAAETNSIEITEAKANVVEEVTKIKKEEPKKPKVKKEEPKGKGLDYTEKELKDDDLDDFLGIT